MRSEQLALKVERLSERLVPKAEKRSRLSALRTGKPSGLLFRRPSSTRRLGMKNASES